MSSQPGSDHRPQKEERKESIHAPTAAAPSSSPAQPLQLEEPPQCSVFFDPKEWSRRYTDTFFTASIISHSLHTDHTIYTIRIQCADAQWEVQHRYSEFEQLLASLHAQYAPAPSPSSASSASLPPLPPKTWLPSREEKFLKERREALQTFLVDLLQRKDICRIQAVREFLVLDTPMVRREEEHIEDDDEEGEGQSGTGTTATAS